jgi:hypothetical protein
MTVSIRRSSAAATRIVVIVGLLGLGGCGGLDGVDFDGKVFEAVGLTGAIGKKAEPVTAARAPLVLPPPGQALQEPGAQDVAAAPAGPAPNPAWPQDPDKTRAATKQAADKQKQVYCQRGGNWEEKAMQGNTGADPCSGSVFSVLGKTLFGE